MSKARYCGYKIEPAVGDRVWVSKDGESSLFDNEGAALEWINEECRAKPPVIISVDTVEQAFDVDEVQRALDRAAHAAVHGIPEERCGRFFIDRRKTK